MKEMRGLAYRRAKARSKGKRLHNLDRQIFSYSVSPFVEIRPDMRTDHWYSKNKIHCSCPWCSIKTRNKGHRRYNKANYLPAVCRSRRDCHLKKKAADSIIPLEDMPVTREELKLLIRTTPFTRIGSMFGVTDNAIRKWCDKFSLPRKVKEIKNYTDWEWAAI